MGFDYIKNGWCYKISGDRHIRTRRATKWEKQYWRNYKKKHKKRDNFYKAVSFGNRGYYYRQYYRKKHGNNWDSMYTPYGRWGQKPKKNWKSKRYYW